MTFLAPLVTASVALVGAGAIAVAPVTPPTAQIRAVGAEVRLTAATATDSCGETAVALCDPSGAAPRSMSGAAVQGTPSIFNIPANLFIALANVPYNFFNALGQGDVNLGGLPDSGFSFVNSRDGIDLNQTGVVGLTADLEYGGSWWVYHPFNVLGTDPADIARYQSLVNVLLPFPALSVGLGNIFAAVAASQLPMNVGCTGTNFGACDRPDRILSTMFDLRHVVALFSPGGYTFPQVRNPITCSSDGLCDIKDPDGVTEPWSQQNQQLNIFTPFENFYNALTQTPDFSRIKFPTVTMIVNTIVNFIRGLSIAFNPFVRGTQCGLCALFVPIPPGETRPGSTNPGTLIPGRPGTDEVTTELTAAREPSTMRTQGYHPDADEPRATTEAQTPESGPQPFDSRWQSDEQLDTADDSQWRSQDHLDGTAPRTDAVDRGDVDGDAAFHGGDDEAGARGGDATESREGRTEGRGGDDGDDAKLHDGNTEEDHGGPAEGRADDTRGRDGDRTDHPESEKKSESRHSDAAA